MTDSQFNSRILARKLWRFRAANAANFQFVVADTLHDAAEQLTTMGYKPEVIQFEGDLISLRNS